MDYPYFIPLGGQYTTEGIVVGKHGAIRLVLDDDFLYVEHAERLMNALQSALQDYGRTQDEELEHEDS